MLEIEQLDAGYRPVRVLHGITLSVKAGEFVGVLGPNGAGKTTLLRAIGGTCSTYAGRIVFAGQVLGDMPDHARAALGIVPVPEGRRIWPSLTVEENLMMGAWRLPRAERKRELGRLLEYVMEFFPRLRERLRARAGVLSGGEQQMLAIGRALMAKPSLILVDEPSIGLAPIMVEAVMQALKRLRQDENLSIILVEQRIQDALDLCDRIYILSRGRMQDIEGTPGRLRREDIEAAYFGRR
ncbi:MAG: ABC transporter ATP-binding protein [Alphaproteobacteria bacterium]